MLEVVVPVNTTATVVIPAADISSVTESGNPVQQAADVKFLKLEQRQREALRSGQELINLPPSSGGKHWMPVWFFRVKGFSGPATFGSISGNYL